MKTLHIADLFCGAGGTSSGAIEAAEALGYKPSLTAVNHWAIAVETHTKNHPEARHLCTGIDDINPRDLYKPGELGVLWASPECTHHSIARGGKPINEQSRATAWCVVRWADALLPPVILVENVPEFITWGPIDSKGRPMKSRKGELFHAWVNNLKALGYRVDWRVLCAADYGDPTTRRRLFIQAVRGRRKTLWPEPSHAPIAEEDLLGRRKPWRTAREIIDWDLKGQSIYERKKPLSEKTMARIMEGLKKYGLKSFIVPGKNENPKGQKPRSHSLDRPLPAVTASGHLDLVEPFLIDVAHGNRVGEVNPNNRRTSSVESPLGTIPCSNRFGIAVVDPFLVEIRGSTETQIENSAHSVEKPMRAVTTKDHTGLAEPFLVKLRNTNNAADIDKPCPAVTSGGTHLALAEPYLVQVNHQGGDRTRSVEKPLPTVAGNRGEFALLEPALLPQQSCGLLRPVSEPAPTISTSGAVALVEPFLVKYYGTALSQSVDDPLDAVTTKERHALVRPSIVIDGEKYLIDIRFRMLQPHELAGAQGFPKGYLFAGNKTEQVKQIGNAVPRNLARAIVHAVLNQ